MGEIKEINLAATIAACEAIMCEWHERIKFFMRLPIDTGARKEL